MKTSEVLYRAADVVRERGWTRFTRQDPYGSVCLLGACAIARDGDPMAEVPLDVWKAVRVVVGDSILYFNDGDGGNRDDCIAALEIAADIAAAEGK